MTDLGILRFLRTTRRADWQTHPLLESLCRDYEYRTTTVNGFYVEHCCFALTIDPMERVVADPLVYPRVRQDAGSKQWHYLFPPRKTTVKLRFKGFHGTGLIFPIDRNSLIANIEIDRKMTNGTLNHFPYRRISLAGGSLGARFHCSWYLERGNRNKAQRPTMRPWAKKIFR